MCGLVVVPMVSDGQKSGSRILSSGSGGERWMSGNKVGSTQRDGEGRRERGGERGRERGKEGEMGGGVGFFSLSLSLSLSFSLSLVAYFCTEKEKGLIMPSLNWCGFV